MVYYDLILYFTLNNVKSQSQRTEQIFHRFAMGSLTGQSPSNLWLGDQSKSFFSPSSPVQRVVSVVLQPDFRQCQILLILG